MNPSEAKDFLEGKGYFFKCPSCSQSVKLVTKILVSALQGMFYISTDATEEEKKFLFRQYGLLNDKGEYEDSEGDRLLNKIKKYNVPNGPDIHRKRRFKIAEEINNKIQLYNQFLEDGKPLDDNEEKSFEDLQIQWENERIKLGPPLHFNRVTDVQTTKKVLFHKLWEDLMQLKFKLDKMKRTSKI